MNKKNRIYLIILLALIVIFVISKLDTKKEKRFRFFNADSNNVARIEIETSEDTLYLVKEAGEWKMTYPVNWALQNGKVKKIFESVFTAESSTIPVSENAASLEKYSLTDSQATLFKTISADGKVLDEVLIGKSSSYSNTPIRKASSNKVYRLESNIGYMVKPSMNSWRRREIVEIDPQQLTKIMVKTDENTFTLEMADSLWIYSDQKDSFSVQDDNAALKGIINSFKRFAASDFVDGKFAEYEDSFKIPEAEIAIEVWTGESYYFRYIPYEEKKYLLQLDENTETLYVQYDSNLTKFTQTAEDFK